MNNMEIERKFLVKNVPADIEKYEYYEIEQAYISTSPAIRVRKKGIPTDIGMEYKYIFTVKSKGFLSHQEFELYLEKDEYARLLLKADGNVITKRRYLIPLDDGLTLELDFFDGAFKGLIMGEIEFPDEASSKKYTPPSFLDREVTLDTRFHNSSMSAMSAEEISDLISLVH